MEGVEASSTRGNSGVRLTITPIGNYVAENDSGRGRKQ